MNSIEPLTNNYNMNQSQYKTYENPSHYESQLQSTSQYESLYPPLTHVESVEINENVKPNTDITSVSESVLNSYDLTNTIKASAPLLQQEMVPGYFTEVVNYVAKMTTYLYNYSHEKSNIISSSELTNIMETNYTTANLTYSLTNRINELNCKLKTLKEEKKKIKIKYNKITKKTKAIKAMFVVNDNIVKDKISEIATKIADFKNNIDNCINDINNYDETNIINILTNINQYINSFKNPPNMNSDWISLASNDCWDIEQYNKACIDRKNTKLQIQKSQNMEEPFKKKLEDIEKNIEKINKEIELISNFKNKITSVTISS